MIVELLSVVLVLLPSSGAIVSVVVTSVVASVGGNFSTGASYLRTE